MSSTSNENEEGEEMEDSEENENSESLSQNEKGRISVYIRICSFNPMEMKFDNTTPFKSIDQENNTIICKKNKY
jgi:hypothetical protein